MKIVVFYDIDKYKIEKRVFSPAVVTVINYISECCNSLGEEIEIISAAETRNIIGSFPFRSEYIKDNLLLTQCATTGHSNLFLRVLSKIKSRLWLVKYLLNNTKKNEIILSWGSPVLFEPLILFKLFSKKNIKIVYFASEIYQEVYKMNWIKRKMEFYLFNHVDKLLVSTELLNNKINKKHLPYLVVNGVYKPVERYDVNRDDDLIHIVYAGIINGTKGANKAIDLARYLNEKYCIHILGYGKDEDINALKECIIDSNKINNCKVFYEGILYGHEYNKFLQKCHIGLCTQNLNEKYNLSSFPSKILSYLANGLRVISVDLEAVRGAEIGDLIFYTKSDSSEDISKTIKSIDFSSYYDSRKRLFSIHNKFLNNLQDFIKY